MTCEDIVTSTIRLRSIACQSLGNDLNSVEMYRGRGLLTFAKCGIYLRLVNVSKCVLEAASLTCCTLASWDAPGCGLSTIVALGLE